MAPSPEYDKEPKAPDKSATNTSTDDPKALYDLVNDQPTNSENKTTNSTCNDMENNKHVEALDDGQLRALLDEAITYKCPKDREGKSSLFKELLEEVEQDEQECEEAARTLSGSRGGRRGARPRRVLPHSNSLQDLVAALAADAPPRRHHVRHPHPQPAPSNVSARAIHGGSLPSGVDTSSLLSEEPARGAGYLATVRCVNPPPLAERRVSASDANAPAEVDVNRRSKPMFPMTYTARATLEIGSGSVCSGRAVTTTTASNQVARQQPDPHHDGLCEVPRAAPPVDSQSKLLSALRPRCNDSACRTRGGGCQNDQNSGTGMYADIDRGKVDAPRGPGKQRHAAPAPTAFTATQPTVSATTTKEENNQTCTYSQLWVNNVDRWYEGLAAYDQLFQSEGTGPSYFKGKTSANPKEVVASINTNPNIIDNIAKGKCIDISKSNSVLSNHFNIKDGTNYIMKLKSNPDAEESHIFHDKRHKLEDNLNRVDNNICDNTESDISLRNYRKKVGTDLVVPTLKSINPVNVKPMSIGKPTETTFQIMRKANKLKCKTETNIAKDKNNISAKDTHDTYRTETELFEIVINCNDVKSQEIYSEKSKFEQGAKSLKFEESNPFAIMDNIKFGDPIRNNSKSISINSDIELISMSSTVESQKCSNVLSSYFTDQRNLLSALEANEALSAQNRLLESDAEETFKGCDIKKYPTSREETKNTSNSSIEDNNSKPPISQLVPQAELKDNKLDTNEVVVKLDRNRDHKDSGDRYILAELPNNAFIFLTLPKRSLIPLNKDNKPSVQIQELKTNNTKSSNPECTALSKSTKKNKEKSVPSGNSSKKNAVYKNALKVLLFENLLKGDKNEKSVSGKSGVSAFNINEVDSAIQFSCITTPEVVASCNTTSSTSQAAVAVDPKPLQLSSGYRAVASVTGAAAHSRSRSPSPSLPRTTNKLLSDGQRAQPQQPRSVISSSFNGLPLSRPNYGSTGTTAPDEFKKSLDENGNSVQGFSSPLSGSSQHKKPRRKKSSKNETVIDCRQIDGYQGDKDVNELLRFIESNAENGRGPKLGRAKHRDDNDDKGKRRRKDRESKVKRATSMEELSRTTIEELTAGGEPAATMRADKRERRDLAAKAERRSWGDDARDAAPHTDTPDAVATELTDFQTVTKKRKPRRRTDENDRDVAPQRTRAPSPRARRESAPPSDRSNDSNDDMDSVHSLPADASSAAREGPVSTRTAVAPVPHASYAEIARTRHNIPDLIESCNFYAEGENGGEARRVSEAPPPAPGDVDGYPALEPRTVTGASPPDARNARRTKGASVAAARRELKERPEGPAPDVVGDRRPPVILLDSTVRSRDMDGVTFGFDINEQLLGGPARRPRCDLVRDAVEAPLGVAVRAGCAALRYLPPHPPPDTNHLLQIVDYVGGAWEDIVRCGASKVRYFSE